MSKKRVLFYQQATKPLKNGYSTKKLQDLQKWPKMLQFLKCSIFVREEIYKTGYVKPTKPIENIWAIIKQDLDGQDLQNIQDLRAGIRASWRRIFNNKTLCADLISSIPNRLKEVIIQKGNQIFKKDYS